MPEEDRRLTDVHHHIIPKEYVENLGKKGVRKALGVRFPKWDVEKTLNVMDKHRISTAIVSISAPGVYFKEVPDSLGFARELARRTNDVCADLIAKHP